MPNNIWVTNLASGRLRSLHSCWENFVSWAFNRERTLLSSIRGRLLWPVEFFDKTLLPPFSSPPTCQSPQPTDNPSFALAAAQNLGKVLLRFLLDHSLADGKPLKDRDLV